MNTIIEQSIEKIIDYLDSNVIQPVICVFNCVPAALLDEYASDIDKTKCNVRESYNWYLERLLKKIRNDCEHDADKISTLLANVPEETLKYQFNMPG